MHFYSWKQGLKTGIYYLRTLPKTAAQKFSVDIEKALDFSKTLKVEQSAESKKPASQPATVEISSTTAAVPITSTAVTAPASTEDESAEGTCMMCSA